MAQKNKTHGAITALSQEYNISRGFVYILLYALKMAIPLIFLAVKESEKAIKRESIAMIVSLRLEGNCSIEAISTIMKRNDMRYSSTGFISQTLKAIGELLPNRIEIDSEDKIFISVVSDEVYPKSDPVLASAEPKSTALLNIELAKDRKATTWSPHLETINSIFDINGITTDEGTGLCSAIKKSLPNVTHQPDTFHGIAKRFGLWVHRLQTNIQKAIKEKEERDEVCMNRKTDQSFENKYKLYEESCIKLDRAL